MDKNQILGLIDVMPLKKKVGQLFLLAFPGKEISEISYLIKEYGIGGCYLSQDNAETPQEAKDLTDKLAEISDIPLINGVDQEGAWGVLVPHSATGPGNLALGAANDTEITKAMYKVIGEEMGKVGFNTILGPCADVNLKPDNPIIDTRSFGEDPSLVSSHVKAAIEGLKEAKSISTAKHFPGHGDTSADSHREIPVVNKDILTLFKEDLKPFKAAINAGVDIIMTSHIKFLQIDPVNPATFSKTILKDLLRGEMGFNGIILSDSMNMGAIRNYYNPEDSAVLAINAGVDMIMLSEEHYDHNGNYQQKQIDTIEKVIKYVEEGIIPELLINKILYRILNFKVDKGLFRKYESSLGIDYKEIELDAAVKSITLVIDDANEWPLKLGNAAVINTCPRDLYKKVLNPRGIGPNQEEPAFDTFIQYLSNRKKEIKSFSYEEVINDLEILERFNSIILVTEDYPLAGEDFIDDRVDFFVYELLSKFKEKIKFVGLRSPYDILKYPEASFYITSYSSRTCSAKAMAEVILNGSVPSGKVILSLG